MLCEVFFMENMADKIEISILYGETEELYTIKISSEEYKRVINGDQELLKKLISKEKENIIINQQMTDFNDVIPLEYSKNMESLESDYAEDAQMEDVDEKIFIWPEKAVMLFLELYRERQDEFTSGLKRHSKLWAEIASELQKASYNVSGVQVQNKMSTLKRTYKKIKDSNAKSGNHNSCWTYNSVMNSLFDGKSWVSPPAVADSDGPAAPSTLTSISSNSSSLNNSTSSSFSMNNFENQDNSVKSKMKKRKVEMILESFISDLKTNRDYIKEERKKERLEKKEKRQQRWEVSRTERKEMHKEILETQKSLVYFLSKLIENKSQ